MLFYGFSIIVIHEQNFVDPNDDDIHTQNVENMWMHVKRKFETIWYKSRTLRNISCGICGRNHFRNENHFVELLNFISITYT